MFLLQMAGYPGSGKSTVSKLIAQKMDGIVIDRDVIKTAMLNSDVSESVAANASYNVVFNLAKFYLEMGRNVIIDTPCYYEESLNNGIEIAKKHGAKYKYIECKLDDYTIIENRINSRKRLISQIDSTTEERFKKAKDKSKKPDNGNYIIIDTSLDINSNMKLIRNYIKG